MSASVIRCADETDRSLKRRLGLMVVVGLSPREDVDLMNCLREPEDGAS